MTHFADQRRVASSGSPFPGGTWPQGATSTARPPNVVGSSEWTLNSADPAEPTMLSVFSCDAEARPVYFWRTAA
jgi:hypothetical protein